MAAADESLLYVFIIQHDAWINGGGVTYEPARVPEHFGLPTC